MSKKIKDLYDNGNGYVTEPTDCIHKWVFDGMPSGFPKFKCHECKAIRIDKSHEMLNGEMNGKEKEI